MTQLERDLRAEVAVTPTPGAPWWRSPVLYPALAIPLKYREPRRLKDTKALRAGRAFAEDGDLATALVALQGGVGCGKTTALCEATRLLVSEDCCDQICFFEFGDLITHLLGPDRAETLEALRECDVAVIDDVGSSYLRKDGMATGLIEEIVLYREARYYPMLISTNLPAEHFRRAFGERVYDRWRGSGRWFNVDGPSLRSRMPA